MKTALVSPRMYLLPSWYPFPTVSEADLGASSFRELQSSRCPPCTVPAAQSSPHCSHPDGPLPGPGALQRSNQAVLEITSLIILRTVIYGSNLRHSPHFTALAAPFMLAAPRCPRAPAWVVSRIKSSTSGTWCASLCKPLTRCCTKQQVSLHKTKGEHPLLFHVSANRQCTHAACSLRRTARPNEPA